MKIIDLVVEDVRFPTSLEGAGSDAMHTDPDYSCAYVVIKTDTSRTGYGLTFTLGKGTEIVCCAVGAYRHLVVGRDIEEIYADFSGFWKELTKDTQMRWLGPCKGVIHLAAASIINALWDLWARIQGKTVSMVTMQEYRFFPSLHYCQDPEELVSTIDFTYLEDSLTKQEAIDILKAGKVGQAERVADVINNGIPAYTTSAGWLGYSDEKIRKTNCIWLKQLCQEALDAGFSRFKVKVGSNQEDDIRRLSMVRECIGTENKLMVDANQCWDANTAIDWMKQLAQFNILWIEEPTSPDDILAHARISKSLASYGISVATGECCQNSVMFKQFLQAGAMQFCQIDSCRLAGPNEILAVILMAAKYKVPVCPHGGGVGLCELVQHFSIWDYISVSKTKENRMTEYVDHLHEHFVDPVIIRNGFYQAPQSPGFSTEMKVSSVSDHKYPDGRIWKELFNSGKYRAP